MTEPDRRRPTPTDGRFRRGLYVMLVVLGVLAAGSLIYARQAHDDSQGAKNRVSALIKANDDLQQDVTRLVNAQQQLLAIQAADEADAQQRSASATRDRALIKAEIEQLRQMILKILANSRDPNVRKAAQASLAPAPSAPASAPHSPSPAPMPTRTPVPSARPSATPTPTPTKDCSVLNLPPICLPGSILG